MEVDKVLILNKIQLYYNFKKDRDFADFLGITTQVLSNWKARNTFDIVVLYTKCVEINPDFLISGNGEIEKEIVKNNVISEPGPDYIIENKLLNSHKKTIEVLENVVTDLRNDKKLLHEIIKNCISTK